MIKVSVVLTTHNGATRGYLKAAADSVITQTFTDYELLIIDDGSTDKTKDVCYQYLNHGNVQYIYQQNSGLAAARNTGIKAANGDYICFIDDDDVWKENKLKIQVSLLDKNKHISMTFTNLEFIDEKGNVIGEQCHFAEGNIFKKLLCENIVDAPSSVMIRREALNRSGLFKEWMKSAEDYELWLRVAREHNIQSINEKLVKYRIHQNKMMRNQSKMEFYTFSALYYATENESFENTNRAYSSWYSFYFYKRFDLKDYKEARSFFWFYFSNQWPNMRMIIFYLLSFFPKLVKMVRK